MNFNFIAGDKLDLNSFNDIEKFVDDFPDFQTVELKDENEIKLLLEIMGIQDVVGIGLNCSDFSKYWDLSAFKLPEFTENQFDEFYQDWIKRSGRDNNMDQYGNLIFLQGLSSKWNKLNYRLLAKEND